MKTFTDFCERHSKFIKRLVLFAVYIFIIAVISSEPVTELFYKLFGEYLTAAVKIVAPFTLVLTEV